MANFNLNDYETVDERLRRFKKDWPDSQIVTELVDQVGNVGATRWVVKTSIWRERHDGRPDATGYAFEVDGSGMANNTSALENCETSSTGRALGNLGYSGNKRATREEMEKVQREEARQADLKQWADNILAFEKAGDWAKIEQGMEWAKKKGDQQKFFYAQGVLQRRPSPQEAQETAQQVLDAEVVTNEQG